MAPTPLKLLVVDDSPAIQQSLAMLMANVAGVQLIGCAEDVAGALELIEACQPDVIILDLALRAGDSGISVLRDVRRRHPDIKVVMLSNFSWHAVHATMIDIGASAYFDKSHEVELARDWIADLADRNRAGLAASDPP